MRLISILVCVACFFFACEKKELPVPKHEVKVRTGGISMPGELIDAQVAMGSDYKNQIWFSLNEAREVAVNLKTDWDLGFECSVEGTHVILNGAKSMKAYKTSFTELGLVKDTSGIGIYGAADSPGGNKDSTAIGNWWDNNTVYIINRGFDEKGMGQGYVKLKLVSVTATEFVFDYSNFDGPEIQRGVIKKDTDYNYRAFSFTTNQLCENIEPKREVYDLCFTQYTHRFTEPPSYYLVTGVLINGYKTRVMRITHKDYSEITINDTLSGSFSNLRNVIGYDWKTYNLNDNLYTVDPKICYLISDLRGYFYKLHFTGFLNRSGVKGYPTFQFQKL